MVWFLVVKLIHSNSNHRFDVSITYLRLIILSVLCNVMSTAMHSLIDLLNLIKPVQS
jgi:hypothetical protein